MKDNYKLYRCILKRINQRYIIAQSTFDKSIYYIEKNSVTRDFKIGNDVSFYARKYNKGILIKKEFLVPIDYEEFLKINEVQD